MHIPKKSTVVVIGGGPAGAFAAGKLAQSGIDVIVLEKEKFPRYQVGESLIPHAWKYFDLLGVTEQIEQAGFIKKSGGAAYWNGTLRAAYFKDHGYNRPGLHIERADFDQILLRRSEELGAQVFEEVKVTKVVFGDNEAKITYQNESNQSKGNITAEYIIDATGQTALLAKQESIREWDKSFQFQAFWGYFDRSNYLDAEGNITDFAHRFTTPPMSLSSSTGNWGWVWNLVLRNEVSVGAIVPKKDILLFKEGGKNLEERFLTYIRNTPLTSTLLEGANLVSPIRTIRDYAYQPKHLVVHNCLLTGDAAAFADPINSQGVTMAIHGGYLAATILVEVLRKPHRKDFYLNLYEETLKKRYDLFKLLSYPDEKIPDNLRENIKSVLLNHQQEENQLIAKHLMVTNRADDFPELLNELNIPLDKMYTELTLKHEVEA